MDSGAERIISNDVGKTFHCSWPGEVIAAALYILNCCPVHSRYLRKGSGLHQPLQQSEYLMSPEEVSKFYQSDIFITFLLLLHPLPLLYFGSSIMYISIKRTELKFMLAVATRLIVSLPPSLPPLPPHTNSCLVD